MQFRLWHAGAGFVVVALLLLPWVYCQRNDQLALDLQLFQEQRIFVQCHRDYPPSERDPAVGDDEVALVDMNHDPPTKATLEAVGRLPQLRILRLHRNVDDQQWAMIGPLPELRQLSFDTCRITDASLPSVGKLEHLEEINLDNTSVTDIGMRELARCEKLGVIYLRQTLVSDAGIGELSRLKNIRWLVLHETGVTSAAFPFIAKMTKLESLSLRNTAVSDRHLELLGRLPKLRYLTLSGTKVTDLGIRRLRGAISELQAQPCLETLDVRNTAVSQEAIKEFEGLAPKLELLYGPRDP